MMRICILKTVSKETVFVLSQIKVSTITFHQRAKENDEMTGTKVKRIKKIFPAMGTLNALTVFNEEASFALDLCKERTLELHDKLSAFDPLSETSAVNNAAGIMSVGVSPDLIELTKISVDFSAITNGAFDITAGPSSMLWKRAIEESTLPSKREIERERKKTDYRDIIIDSTNSRIGLKKKGQSLDFGAVAKGYAADESARILEECGVKNAIVNYGGSVVVIGDSQNVGIRDPFSVNGAAFAALKAKDSAVVTSGIYEQSFVSDGTVCHHIINPLTGKPAKTDLVSVTLTGLHASDLDAYATAMFAMELEDAFDFVREKEIEAIFITNNREVLITNGIKNDFSFL